MLLRSGTKANHDRKDRFTGGNEAVNSMPELMESNTLPEESAVCLPGILKDVLFLAMYDSLRALSRGCTVTGSCALVTFSNL